MSDVPMPPAVLEARNLSKDFPVGGTVSSLVRGNRSVSAVHQVSLSLHAGRTVALVGESGSGKSTLARLLARLDQPSSGEILVDGRPAARSLRRHTRTVQMVLQDPFASLNPVHTVGYTLSRPIRLAHGGRLSRAEVTHRTRDALVQVHLTPPDQVMAKYPHELSGGQRQRVSIARALAAEPRVLLADEPISMLDVSIRLGILNVLDETRTLRELAVLYVTHDIATARYFSDTSVVMYAGQAVESGPSDDVILNPAHPYTQMLVAAAPRPRRRGSLVATATGEPPSLVTPPTGCRFHPRCPLAMDICVEQEPPEVPLTANHWSKCWLPAESLTSPPAPAASSHPSRTEDRATSHDTPR